eukprot:Nk52_evm15s281 gene=Nk52_evmTU15s281
MWGSCNGSRFLALTGAFTGGFASKMPLLKMAKRSVFSSAVCTSSLYNLRYGATQRLGFINLYKHDFNIGLNKGNTIRGYSSQRKSLDYHYKVLGVDTKASQKEIKSAYYALSMKHHPDAQKEPSEKSLSLFHDINEAYAILSRPKLRRQYDMGHNVNPAEYERTRSSDFGRDSKRRYSYSEVKFDFAKNYQAHYSEALHEERRRKRARKENKDVVETHSFVYFVLLMVSLYIVTGMAERETERRRKQEK